jgi:RNA-directed DNA polymerase
MVLYRMVKSISAGNRVMANIKRFLKYELRPEINEKKSKVAPMEECGFLGFVFVNGKIRWSDKSFLEFKRRLRRLTGRSWFVSMEYRYEKLAEYVRGWMNYYGISEYYRPIP